MGRSSRITFELVSETAEKLLAEGKPYSMAAVQEQLGGSLSTISRYYKEWREKKGPIISPPPSPEPPPDALNKAFEMALAKKYSELHAGYSCKLKEIQAEVDLHVEVLTKLENENEGLESAVKEAKNNFLIIKGENNELKNRLTSLESEKAELFKRYDESREKCMMMLDENKLMMKRLNSVIMKLEDLLKKNVITDSEDGLTNTL
jgi:predicted phage-related endonuclease